MNSTQTKEARPGQDGVGLGDDTADRLRQLRDGLGPDEGGADDGPQGPTQQAAAADITPEQAAEIAVQMANEFCSQQGLTPLNDIQSFLLRVGIAGTAKKYGLSFDVANYPELALAGGAAWIVADKVKEYRKNEAAKQAEALKRKEEEKTAQSGATE